MTKDTEIKGHGGVVVEMPDGLVKETLYIFDLLDGPPKAGTYAGPFVEIGFSCEISVDMGDKYTKAKPRAWMSIPVHPAKADQGWQVCYNWVDARLAEVASGIAAQFEDGKNSG